MTGSQNNTEQYILIVEDSPVDYEIITRSLRKAGLDRPVEHCESGAAALSFLGLNGLERESGTWPALILLDLNMPGIDGKHVLETVKNHKTLKSVPIIVLTTSNNENDIKACYAKGANSYLQKPANPDDFVDMVEALKHFWFDWTYLPEAAF